MSASISLPAIGKTPIAGTTIETTDARALHAFLGVGRDFITWFRDRAQAYGFTEGVDFVEVRVLPETGENPLTGSFTSERARGGRPQLAFAISLDMAKELAMVERTDRGREARRYFIECERRLREGRSKSGLTPSLPQTFAEALRVAADLAEKNEAQARAIAVLEPRSEALALIADADGSCSVTVAAKTLQMPPGELWAYLAREQWVYRRDRDSPWSAFQSKITAGYLTHKAVPIPVEGRRGRSFVKHQVMVTAKGLTALAQRIPLDTVKSSTVPVLPRLKSDTVSDLPASQGGR